MERFPYPDLYAGSPDVADTRSRLPMQLNVFRMAAHAETAFVPWLRYGAALLTELELDPVLRELAILEVARLSQSRYEWVQHEGIATALGVPADQLAALAGGNLESLPPAARAVVDFTREVVDDVRASDAALHVVRRVLSPRATVELLLVIGQYMAIARLVETTAIEVDPPAQLAVVDAARRESARS